MKAVAEISWQLCEMHSALASMSKFKITGAQCTNPSDESSGAAQMVRGFTRSNGQDVNLLQRHAECNQVTYGGQAGIVVNDAAIDAIPSKKRKIRGRRTAL